MNNIQSNFTIKDLEHFSGIKAHTIRIWEKRYKLLDPARTDSNIRYYDLENLQKLLNVTYLYNNGFKISKIAHLNENDLNKVVQEQIKLRGPESHFIEDMKLSMARFDFELFNKTYEAVIAKYSFEDVFKSIFLPLLSEIGLLWHSNAITPAHEHFITNLIQQKILINIESALKTKKNSDKRLFVLYLPMNEIHEIGLLFIHHQLLSKGYKSIYLGQSIPMDNLQTMTELNKEVVLVSYFTVKPAIEDAEDYLNKLHNLVFKKKKAELWVLGTNTRELDSSKLPSSIKVFKDAPELIGKL